MAIEPSDQTKQELKQPTEFHFEIIKLEYEQAAQRFENIYKAIWQIFSYMAALTAAIFAFGASNFPLPAVVLIAPLPLLFWWLAIFIPMDFYGRQARTRLSGIEDKINDTFLKGNEIQLAHYKNFNNVQNQSRPEKSRWDLIGFFIDRIIFSETQKWSKSKYPEWRVSEAVTTFALLGIIACLLSFYMTLPYSKQLNSKSSKMTIKLEPPVQVQTQAPQLQRLETKLISLSDKLDSIEFLLRTRNSATPNNNVGKPRQ